MKDGKTARWSNNDKWMSLGLIITRVGAVLSFKCCNSLGKLCRDNLLEWNHQDQTTRVETKS